MRHHKLLLILVTFLAVFTVFLILKTLSQTQSEPNFTDSQALLSLPLSQYVTTNDYNSVLNAHLGAERGNDKPVQLVQQNERLQQQQQQQYPQPVQKPATVNSTISNYSNNDTKGYVPVCLEEKCLQEAAYRIARVYQPHKIDKWCLKSEIYKYSSDESQIDPASVTHVVTTETALVKSGNSTSSVILTELNDTEATLLKYSPRWQGLLLIKVPKAASSTSAGVVLRIHDQLGCAVQWQHRYAYEYGGSSAENRHYVPEKSFILGSIRKTVSRAVSSLWFFYFSPSRILDPTSEQFIKGLKSWRGRGSKGQGGLQYSWLSINGKVKTNSVWKKGFPEFVYEPDSLVNNILNDLMQSYNMILVVERMDESLTVLALLMGIDVSQVLVTSSKVAGQYMLRAGGKKKKKKSRENNNGKYCQRIYTGPTPELAKEYMQSKEWLASNYADEILHRAANRSLDMTIESIGKDKFDAALSRLRYLKSLVLEKCNDRLGYGCTPTGEVIPGEVCYLRDFGCGYGCMDSAINTTKYAFS